MQSLDGRKNIKSTMRRNEMGQRPEESRAGRAAFRPDRLARPARLERLCALVMPSVRGCMESRQTKHENEGRNGLKKQEILGCISSCQDNPPCAELILVSHRINLFFGLLRHNSFGYCVGSASLSSCSLGLLIKF